jgi:hypothetical protein
MKTFVDTCIWSLALRRRSNSQLTQAEQDQVAQLRELIRDGDVCIIGSIRQEVLSGIREPAHFARIEAVLAAFRDEQIIPGDYVEAARLFNVCRNRGIECGAIDILLCAIAVRLSYTILTDDRGLSRCVETLRSQA